MLSPLELAADGGRPGARVRARHLSVSADGPDRERDDWLATEEPMELRVHGPDGARVTAAVTMRTPGQDFELAVGFLLGEGIVGSRDDVRAVRYCVDRALDEEQRFNVVSVDLTRGDAEGLRRLERSFAVTSACGVCGTQSLADLEARGIPAIDDTTAITRGVLWSLPDALRDGQQVFDRTGGLHAAGLFTAEGTRVALREDVGRHNALDKLLGWALLDGRLPLTGHVLVLSGRASYELLQKAATAGVPIVCALSAPSSLAVDVARRFGITLVGFLRDGHANVYTHPERVRP